jgi:hypothetical protein
MNAHQKNPTLQKMLTSEEGSLSVEFALWMPVIFMILMFVADTSAALFAQANMWHIAGDISRAIATGRMSVAEAQHFLLEHTRYSIDVSLAGDMVLVQLSQPFADIGTGVTLSFVGDIQVQVFQHLEQGINQFGQGGNIS